MSSRTHSSETGHRPYKGSKGQFKNDLFLGTRFEHESFWVRYQPFLLTRGYKLRPRFHPDWVPTWKKLDEPIEDLYNFEDAIVLSTTRLIDAVRLFDGSKVVLKRVDTSTQEIPIARYLSSKPLSDDRRNHTIPIKDVILLPDDDTQALLVMPLLFPHHILPFRHVNEFIVFMRQCVEGLQFMHEQNISHRDACWGNIMMDGSKLLPEGFHFDMPYTRDGVIEWQEWNERKSDKLLRYYLIDFGLSNWYPPGMKGIKVLGIVGQDRTVPERSRTVCYDPFKMDIYQLGNVFQQVIKDHTGLELVRGLVNAMTSANPNDRPSLSQVLDKLDRLHWWQLRRRIWKHDSFFIERVLVRFFGFKAF